LIDHRGDIIIIIIVVVVDWIKAGRESIHQRLVLARLPEVDFDINCDRSSCEQAMIMSAGVFELHFARVLDEFPRHLHRICIAANARTGAERTTRYCTLAPFHGRHFGSAWRGDKSSGTIALTIYSIRDVLVGKKDSRAA